MKKIWKQLAILSALCCILYYVIFGSPFIDWRDHQLKKALQTIDVESTATLEELVPFAWDAVYEFEPYTSRERIEKTIGFHSFEITESNSENVYYLYFVNDNKIVCNARNSASELGCYVDLPYLPRSASGDEGGYRYLRYGDNILFGVVYQNDSKFLQPVERGTVETFTYQNLKLQISNIHSVRTETYMDPIDSSYQWDCVIYTYYPGAELTILNADVLDSGEEARSQWKIELENVEGYPYLAGANLPIKEKMPPLMIRKNMTGVYHYESMIKVLQFELYEEAR